MRGSVSLFKPVCVCVCVCVCVYRVRTSRSVLLDDVARVVELSESCRQLVQVVTQRVRRQVRNAAVDDFREAENQLGEFPLLGIVQLYGSTTSS